MSKNINEIRYHIDEIIYLLDQVESDLDSARGWGIWDLFGGKTIVSLMKHSKIGDAESRLRKAEREIYKLQDELEDLDLKVDSKINAGSFNKFMDIFVDHPIADIYSQSKIKDGLKNVKTIRRALEDLSYDLDQLP